jgi:uncharacterized protein (DUF1501 family)
MTSAVAQSTGPYRAVVTLFQNGGNDGFNTLVPIDDRYAAYAAARGPRLALPRDSLIPLRRTITDANGQTVEVETGYGLHPALAPLVDVWNDGDMSWVMNVGTLVEPMTRQEFREFRKLRPDNLGSHSHEVEHWHSMRPGSVHPNGVLGRMSDHLGFNEFAVPPLMSVDGPSIALMGEVSSPLILPMYTRFFREGHYPDRTDAVTQTRLAALASFATPREGHPNILAKLTAAEMERSYAAGNLVNPALADDDRVDRFFRNEEGYFRDTPLSRQMRMIARMIFNRASFGHNRQIFMAGHGDYDLHANQVNDTIVYGPHYDLLNDLALSLRSFVAFLTDQGLRDQVAVMTMSDFGRTFKGNGSYGSDHGWGNNHFVIGGALDSTNRIHGTYPTLEIGGPSDSEFEGSWIPTLASDEYFAPVAQWFGVDPLRMDSVLPNWGTWSRYGRGPVPLFAQA